jgi:hypothetical protein
VTPAEVDSGTFTVTSRIDGLAGEFIEETVSTLNMLIQSKVELTKRKNALEDQIDYIKNQGGVCEQNIRQLQEENQRIERFVNESCSSGKKQEINEENLDSLVYASDPYSGKIVELTAKENAIEDCIMALQKAFKEETITFKEFIEVRIQIGL